MNIRKCPKCGGCVPEGNNNCNHCGHKMGLFGGSTLYVGSSKNANKLDAKENPFNDGKSNKVYKWVIIIFIIGFIFNIFLSILEEGNIDIEYMINDVLFGDFDVDYSDNYLNQDNENYCYSYCGSYDYEVDAHTNCLCYNGNIFDSNGNKLFTGTNNEEENLKGRCEYFCGETGVMIDNVCHCKTGNKYDTQGFVINNDTEYIARTLMNKIDDGDYIFVYGPGVYKDSYLDPVELVNFMEKYDIDVYYFDFSSLYGSIRNDLRDNYKFQNYVMPHYYIFKDGSLVYGDISVSSKEDLESSLKEYFNK